MKKWAIGFWKVHGERIVFLTAAVVMASVFMLFPNLADTGKTVLIGIVMLLFNKARSPKAEEEPQKEN